jgi:lipopolysaccharide transport system ATP-binding protein
VKHYSTGMYLRLAFAVAAHLEPEILVIDEVLAVGDAGFQRKCLSKMEDVGDGGRTVLFVSHNMPAVARLCDRTILLDGGRLLEDGPSHRVVATYLSTGLGTTAVREWSNAEDAPGNDIARLIAVRVRTEEGVVSEVVDIRRAVGVEMEFEVETAGYPLLPHFYLINQEGVKLFTSFNLEPQWRGTPWPPGRYRSTGWIPGNFLAEGTMIVGVALRSIEPHLLHFHERDAVAFQVVDAVGGDTARGDWTRDIPGVVRPLLRWSTEYEPVHGRPPAITLQPVVSAE